MLVDMGTGERGLQKVGEGNSRYPSPCPAHDGEQDGCVGGMQGTARAPPLKEEHTKGTSRRDKVLQVGAVAGGITL